MDINELRAYITLATFLTFLGICWWAYRSGNKERFEQDALLPFSPNELPEKTGAPHNAPAREKQA